VPVSISTSRLTLATLVLTSASDSDRFYPRWTAWMLPGSAISGSVKSALRKAASLSAAASDPASSARDACGLAWGRLLGARIEPIANAAVMRNLTLEAVHLHLYGRSLVGLSLEFELHGAFFGNLPANLSFTEI